MSRLLSFAVVMVLAVALIGAGSQPVEAAKRTCAKRGYSVDLKTYEAFAMRKTVRDKSMWPGAATDYYVCSRKHRRRVNIGTYGVSHDGEIDFHSLTMSSNHAALFTGIGSNAIGPEYTGLKIHDLRTGKRRSINLENQASGEVVSAPTFSIFGDFAWIAPDSTGDAFGTAVYLVGRSSGRKVQRVANGPDIDPQFLKFTYVGGKAVLVWSTAASNHTIP